MQLFPVDEVEIEAIAVDPTVLAYKALAAQHLVASDILCRGYAVSTAAEKLRYDLIADIGGLKRVQVKMTTGLQMAGGYLRYRFWGGNYNSKLRDYMGDIDLFAFVAMDIRRIKYALPANIDLVTAAFKPADFDLDRCELGWQQAVRSWAGD